MGDYQVAYATQNEPVMLNGRVSAQIRLVDRHHTGAGLICRADDMWSFLAFYVAPGQGSEGSTVARIAAFREGLFVPIATTKEPVSLSPGFNEFSFEFFSAHLRGEIRADGRKYELEVSAPHIPFPGRAGLVKFYQATIQARSVVAIETDMPSRIRMDKQVEFDFDVFLCHSSADKPVVTELAATLAKAGVTYWLDSERIEYGQQITRQIEDGLQCSRYLLPCFSAEQKKSGWVRAEYGAILNAEFRGDEKRRAIPVLLEETAVTSLPPLLQDRKWVSYQNKVEFDNFIQFLLRR